MNELSTVVSKGYILYCEKLERSSSDKMNPFIYSDKILEEFLPHLLKQQEGRPFLEYDNFSQAVDEFFAHIGSQIQVCFLIGLKTTGMNVLPSPHPQDFVASMAGTLQKVGTILYHFCCVIKLGHDKLSKCRCNILCCGHCGHKKVTKINCKLYLGFSNNVGNSSYVPTCDFIQKCSTC
jgi:hypothetical protein